ncbi:cell division protein, partial [Burkholderia sp. BCCIQ07D]|nr:cell division protein [Burkholderia anthinoferrum]
LALAPKRDGIDVTFVKRRGPARDTPLFVPLSPSPILLNRHASLDRRAAAPRQQRSVPSAIAGAVA